MELFGFDYVARQIPSLWGRLSAVPQRVKDQAFDLHVARGQPVSISGREGVFFLGKEGAVSRDPAGGEAVSPRQLRELFLQACGHSVFCHEEEIRQGFVRLGENCRVGVCGEGVREGAALRSVREVTSLVYRIPRVVPGCGDRLFLLGLPVERGLLLAGPPSSGKTTLLRDVARSLSLGRFGPSRRVAVVDERGELGGGDLGPNADLLRGYPKALGIEIALRTLSPEVILCDELGEGQVEAVQAAAATGAAVIASVHGEPGRLRQRPLCRALLDTGVFPAAACLSGRAAPGVVAQAGLVGGDGRLKERGMPDGGVGSRADRSQRGDGRLSGGGPDEAAGPPAA